MSSGSGKIIDLIDQHRIIICCGSGGVGKTTTSAAIAALAALRGKKTVVITIDPAKRLANSLGLETLSPEGTDLTDRLFSESKKKKGEKGQLVAIMPDTSKTFENFVKSMAGESNRLTQRIFASKIYKTFTQDFAGANEYMAMEKLFQLFEADKYDLIVLDTPPSSDTKQFLEAPALLAEFFDDQMIRWFVTPGSRLLATGLKKVLEILERLTGTGFISELIDFTGALFEMRTQFLSNLSNISELLKSDQVAFLAISSPARLSKSDTMEFVDLLEKEKYPFWGFIINRMVSKRLGIASISDLKKLSEDEGLQMPFVLRTVEENLGPQLDREAKIETMLRGYPFIGIAEQEHDVHSIEALIQIAEQLLQPEEEKDDEEKK